MILSSSTNLKDKKDWKTDLERVIKRQRKSEKEKGNKWKKLENERMKENKKDWDIWKNYWKKMHNLHLSHM